MTQIILMHAIKQIKLINFNNDNNHEDLIKISDFLFANLKKKNKTKKFKKKTCYFSYVTVKYNMMMHSKLIIIIIN